MCANFSIGWLKYVFLRSQQVSSSSDAKDIHRATAIQGSNFGVDELYSALEL